MGYKVEAVPNPQFFGKKVDLGLTKIRDVTPVQLILPVSAVEELVYWRWDWRGPGGYKIGKLEGAATMMRVHFTKDKIIADFPNKADGRFFQTGYLKSPSELMKACVTVKDLLETFLPEEVKFSAGLSAGTSAVQPSPKDGVVPSNG